MAKGIKGLNNEEGVEVRVRKGIQEIVLQYFRSIFGYIHPTVDAMEELASKSIANRLKTFLDSLISPSQSAFVPGRFITDNVLVAYELNHFLKHKNRGKDGYVFLKLDVSKTYDHVEWGFHERVLGRLGFLERFVSLIMSCVSPVTFSFLLNGEQFGLMSSGLKINFHKSAMTASSIVAAGLKEELAGILGVAIVVKHDK
ncbi:UNVERIFIED_CONTAM: hypothetical protein Sradi_6935400 [Sesamum radiatum]|uniref:Reverse transcriptase domain-containing protein n=1 Tax=Sesamum radiatum TaxID=300843 RepID=A0AAW2JG75_SESRA